MRGEWKTKEPIPFPASPVLESGAFSYSKANEAMQARDAAGATRMRTTPGTPVRSQKQFEWMRLKFFGGSIVAAVILGIGVPAGWSQQMQEKPHNLELSRAVRPWEFLPVTGTRAGLLGDESGRMEAWVYPLKIFREFQMKFAKDLQRVHPRFHAAGFIPQQSCASSRDRQKFPGAHRARKLEIVRLFLHLLAPTGGDADSQDHRGHDGPTKKFQPHPFELFLRANRRSRRGAHSGGPRCVACLHCLVGLTISASTGF